jgi:hypothetical protein
MITVINAVFVSHKCEKNIYYGDDGKNNYTDFSKDR